MMMWCSSVTQRYSLHNTLLFFVYVLMHAHCRCSTVLPGTYFNLVRCLTSPASVPPKRPPNAYIRYVVQQKPVVTRQNPGKSATLVTWEGILSYWLLMATTAGSTYVHWVLRKLIKITLICYSTAHGWARSVWDFLNHKSRTQMLQFCG